MFTSPCDLTVPPENSYTPADSFMLSYGYRPSTQHDVKKATKELFTTNDITESLTKLFDFDSISILSVIVLSKSIIENPEQLARSPNANCVSGSIFRGFIVLTTKFRTAIESAIDENRPKIFEKELWELVHYPYVYLLRSKSFQIQDLATASIPLYSSLQSFPQILKFSKDDPIRTSFGLFFSATVPYIPDELAEQSYLMLQFVIGYLRALTEVVTEPEGMDELTQHANALAQTIAPCFTMIPNNYQTILISLMSTILLKCANADTDDISIASRARLELFSFFETCISETTVDFIPKISECLIYLIEWSVSKFNFMALINEYEQKIVDMEDKEAVLYLTKYENEGFDHFERSLISSGRSFINTFADQCDQFILSYLDQGNDILTSYVCLQIIAGLTTKASEKCTYMLFRKLLEIANNSGIRYLRLLALSAMRSHAITSELALDIVFSIVCPDYLHVCLPLFEAISFLSIIQRLPEIVSGLGLFDTIISEYYSIYFVSIFRTEPDPLLQNPKALRCLLLFLLGRPNTTCFIGAMKWIRKRLMDGINDDHVGYLLDCLGECVSSAKIDVAHSIIDTLVPLIPSVHMENVRMALLDAVSQIPLVIPDKDILIKCLEFALAFFVQFPDQISASSPPDSPVFVNFGASLSNTIFDEQLCQVFKRLTINDQSESGKYIMNRAALKLLIEHSSKTDQEIDVLTFLNNLIQDNYYNQYVCFDCDVLDYVISRAADPSIIRFSLQIFSQISSSFFSYRTLQKIVKCIVPPDGLMNTTNQLLLDSLRDLIIRRDSTSLPTAFYFDGFRTGIKASLPKGGDNKRRLSIATSFVTPASNGGEQPLVTLHDKTSCVSLLIDKHQLCIRVVDPEFTKLVVLLNSLQNFVRYTIVICLGHSNIECIVNKRRLNSIQLPCPSFSKGFNIKVGYYQSKGYSGSLGPTFVLKSKKFEKVADIYYEGYNSRVPLRKAIVSFFPRSARGSKLSNISNSGESAIFKGLIIPYSSGITDVLDSREIYADILPLILLTAIPRADNDSPAPWQTLHSVLNMLKNLLSFGIKSQSDFEATGGFATILGYLAYVPSNSFTPVILSDLKEIFDKISLTRLKKEMIEYIWLNLDFWAPKPFQCQKLVFDDILPSFLKKDTSGYFKFESFDFVLYQIQVSNSRLFDNFTFASRTLESDYGETYLLGNDYAMIQQKKWALLSNLYRFAPVPSTLSFVLSIICDHTSNMTKLNAFVFLEFCLLSERKETTASLSQIDVYDYLMKAFSLSDATIVDKIQHFIHRLGVYENSGKFVPEFGSFAETLLALVPQFPISPRPEEFLVSALCYAYDRDIQDVSFYSTVEPVLYPEYLPILLGNIKVANAQTRLKIRDKLIDSIIDFPSSIEKFLEIENSQRLLVDFIKETFDQETESSLVMSLLFSLVRPTLGLGNTKFTHKLFECLPGHYSINLLVYLSHNLREIKGNCTEFFIEWKERLVSLEALDNVLREELISATSNLISKQGRYETPGKRETEKKPSSGKVKRVPSRSLPPPPFNSVPFANARQNAIKSFRKFSLSLLTPGDRQERSASCSFLPPPPAEMPTLATFRVSLRKLVGIYCGALRVFTDSIAFDGVQTADGFGSLLAQNEVPSLKTVEVSLSTIQFVFLRRYLHSDDSCEIFRVSGKPLLLTFTSMAERDMFLSIIDKTVTPRIGRTPLSSFLSDLASACESVVQKLDSPTLAQKVNLIEKWHTGKIDNFHFLTFVNLLAGRSFSDLSQYPVFPWVIRDYSRAHFSIDDPQFYRDFTKPIGTLNPTRLKGLQNSLQHIDDPSQMCLFRTHYSSPAAVVGFLIRKQPFASLHVRLQEGRFDTADRLFYSLPAAWRSVTNSLSDYRELTPEFFMDSTFLSNLLGLKLGVRTTGVKVEDVDLPQWANNSEDFIVKHRNALEGTVCSAGLSSWVDMIFGIDQLSEEKNNVFHPYSYPAKRDREEEGLARDYALNFGSCPIRVFNSHVPPKPSCI